MPNNTRYLVSNTTEVNLQETDGFIDIIRVGDWTESAKNFEITMETLQDFVANFQSNVLRYGKGSEPEIPLNYSHESWAKAAGWFKELRIVGDTLQGKPELTPEGRRTIKDGEFKYISAEIDFRWQDRENQKVFKNVLLGAALTNIPFVQGMSAAVALSDDLQKANPDKNQNPISLCNRNMDMFQKFLAQLQGQNTVALSAVEALKSTMVSLSDEEKAKVEPEVEKLEEKAKADEAASAEEAKAKEAELAAAKAQATLSSDAVSRQNEALKSQVTTLSTAMEAMQKERAEAALDAKLDKLSTEGKIAPAQREKTKTLLSSLTKEQQDAHIELLSSMAPQVVDGKIGSTADTTLDASSEAAKYQNKLVLAAEMYAKDPSKSVDEYASSL
jgi:phage I-like protein